MKGTMVSWSPFPSRARTVRSLGSLYLSVLWALSSFVRENRGDWEMLAGEARGSAGCDIEFTSHGGCPLVEKRPDGCTMPSRRHLGTVLLLAI